MTTTQKADVVMEQRADIKQILAIPFIRDLAKGEGAGLHINMIGPIYVSNDKTQNNAGMLPEEAQGPLLLRGMNANPDISDQIVKKFEPIYNKLPEPKLDATIRLVTECAYRKDHSPKSIAKALDCSIYKARGLMQKFGLSS